MILTPSVRRRLLTAAQRRSAWVRDPDEIIGAEGDEYLLRWFLIPKNRFFNLYLHLFKRSDDDRALHDHPWASVSLVLRGSYDEVLPGRVAWRREGSVAARRARTPHRVRLIARQPVWTLFVTGPRVREWGFHCPNGWRHWKDYVRVTPGGNQVGRGCD